MKICVLAVWIKLISLGVMLQGVITPHKLQVFMWTPTGLQPMLGRGSLFLIHKFTLTTMTYNRYEMLLSDGVYVNNDKIIFMSHPFTPMIFPFQE